jgi:tRNA A37 threonylcarbamoyltransferase TsaD
MQDKEEICYEFQNAIIEVLSKKVIDAAKEYEVSSIMLAG